MYKLLGSLLLIIGIAGVAMAQPCGPLCSVPEIDPGSSANALALLAGVGLMIRGRRKQ